MNKNKQSLTTLAFIKYYNIIKFRRCLKDIYDTKIDKAVLTNEYVARDFYAYRRGGNNLTLYDIVSPYTYCRDMLCRLDFCDFPSTLFMISELQERKRLLGDKSEYFNSYLDGDSIDFTENIKIKLERLKIYREAIR